MSYDSPNSTETELVSPIYNVPALILKRGKSKGKTLQTEAAELVADATAPSGADPLSLGELAQVEVSRVVVEGRLRRDLDVEPLARSLAEIGLAQPILLDRELRLVCGLRRLRAAESLGWQTIAARIVDIDDPMALMIAEDAARKDLNSSEKYAIYMAVRERAQDPEYRRRSFGGRLEEAKKKGRLDEEIGGVLRLSRESLRKLKAVHDAAGVDRERYGDLVAKLDADGRVDRHFRELQKRQGRGDASRAAAIVIVPGWHALYEIAETAEVGKFAKAHVLAAGADDGTVLAVPTSLRGTREAAGLLRQCGAEWRETLLGSGAPNEEVWLLAAFGKKAQIPVEATKLIAEACLQGGGAIGEAMEIAFDGETRSLELKQEARS